MGAICGRDGNSGACEVARLEFGRERNPVLVSERWRIGAFTFQSDGRVHDRVDRCAVTRVGAGDVEGGSIRLLNDTPPDTSNTPARTGTKAKVKRRAGAS